MESTYNKQKTKKVYKNMSTDSFEMEEFLPVSPIIPMYELFKSKYPSISDNYTFHIPLDENSNNPTEKVSNSILNYIIYIFIRLSNNNIL